MSQNVVSKIIKLYLRHDSSSDPSIQSLWPSHKNSSLIHSPFLHWNWLPEHDGEGGCSGLSSLLESEIFYCKKVWEILRATDKKNSSRNFFLNE
jgi:hypothetical protein